MKFRSRSERALSYEMDRLEREMNSARAAAPRTWAAFDALIGRLPEMTEFQLGEAAMRGIELSDETLAAVRAQAR